MNLAFQEVISQWYFNTIKSEFFNAITIPAIAVFTVYLLYRLLGGLFER